MPPDLAPTAVLAGELADALSAAGHTVIRIGRTRGEAAVDPAMRVIDRVPVSVGLVAKLRSWPRFAWRAWRLLRRELRAGDLLIVCSDPPLFYPLAVAAARRSDARVIHWSQDVYPEVVQAHWPQWAPWLRPLRHWRDRALRRLDALVAISAGMAARMPGAPRVLIIPNWTHVQPASVPHSALRAAHFRADEFVVMYSGNLGRVHEFDTLARAAAALAGEPQIRFLIVGGGPRLAELQHAVAGNPAFVFLPLRPAEELADALAAADVHLVSLRSAFDGLVLPSKLYGVAASARPILYCGDPAGEAAQMLTHVGCGLSVAEGDAEGLAQAIRRLREDHALRQQLGARAPQLLALQGDRREALRRWQSLVAELLGDAPVSP